MINERELIHLPSGRKIPVSSSVYDNYFSRFTEYQYFYFNTLMNSALYFPQIIQFIFVMICICSGIPSFGDVFICYLFWGVVPTFAWFFLKLHKFIPGICYVSCLIGGNIFRYQLHYIAIILVSLLVTEDWSVIFYCLAGGIITGIIRSLLVGLLSTVKYNDSAVIFASRFKS